LEDFKSHSTKCMYSICIKGEEIHFTPMTLFPKIQSFLLMCFANFFEFFPQFSTLKIGKKRKALTLMMVYGLQFFRLMKTWTYIFNYPLTSWIFWHLVSGVWHEKPCGLHTRLLQV
jgi:hypothetical protein